MKTTGLLIAVLLAAAPLTASADRLTDKQVDATIDQVKKSYDRWKDGLEKANMDDAVIRSAAGTTDVKQFLKGFKDDLDKLDDKFGSQYYRDPRGDGGAPQGQRRGTALRHGRVAPQALSGPLSATRSALWRGPTASLGRSSRSTCSRPG